MMVAKQATWFARHGVHALRVALLAGIILLLRWQHVAFVTAQQRLTQELLPLTTVQEFFPTAASTVASASVKDGQDVFNAANELLGTLLQTSPTADDILGFSGPTNAMIVCDAESRIMRVAILSSRDTREHVQQVKHDSRFLQQYEGKTLAEIAKSPPVNVVSGATLTSYAIAESILKRLGSQRGSLKFANPPTVEDAQILYPTVAKLLFDAGEPSMIRVRNKQDKPLGWMLRTSPAADNTIGYQGPTDTLIGFASDGKIIGVAVRKSYDNEPYVGYVRDDSYFREFFNGKSLEELAGLDLKSSGMEGVSGATMTSLGVAKGILLAARNQTAVTRGGNEKQGRSHIGWSDLSSILMIALGSLIGLTNMRGNARIRIAWQLVVIVFLGFANGALLSQTLFVGWAQAGVPRGALSLIVLSLAAFILPITTKRNIYCSHLCPHGAVQHLAMRFARPHWNPPTAWKQWLLLIPGLLLAWCVLVGMRHLSFSLVDIEPFDAYLFRIAGVSTIAIAVAGIIASCFSPMAYCRYGCPTGALLEFLRSNARSEQWTRRDWFAVGLLALAILLFLLPQS